MLRDKLRRKLKGLLKDLRLSPVILLPQISFLPSFYIPLPFLKIIHVRWPYEDHLYHEVGHYHLDTYYGTAIDPKEFTDIFGNKDSWYFGKWWFSRRVLDAIGEHKDYPSAYARVHPKEDYAESFILAMVEVRSGCHKYYGSRTLNRKVRMVKSWIKKSQFTD